MNSGPEGAKHFLSVVNGQKNFTPHTWQSMTFLHPLGALIPKSHFHFLPIFFGPGHLWGLGSASVGIWGAVN